MSTTSSAPQQSHATPTVFYVCMLALPTWAKYLSNLLHTEFKVGYVSRGSVANKLILSFRLEKDKIYETDQKQAADIVHFNKQRSFVESNKASLSICKVKAKVVVHLRIRNSRR